MIESLIAHFEKYVPFEDQERDAIRKIVQVRTVGKNEILLREGELSNEFYFIIKGCVRLYYDTDAEEKTAFFYVENMFVSSYESFTKQTPSKHNLQAIEESTLAVITTETAQQLLELSPKFQFLAMLMMEEELIVYQEIISSFITLNAEERYLELIKNKPDLAQRIPQHQLATFLGVTAETLSRIRKRISEKENS